MNRQELHECVYKQVMDTINASERYTVIRNAIDAYVAAEIERVTEVTPKMVWTADNNIKEGLWTVGLAKELTAALRERAKS